MPAAALTNTESSPLPPPIYHLLWKEQGTLKLLQLVAPPGAGGSLAKLRARLHPHGGEEEQRYGVTQRHGEELLLPPGWHREGGSGAGGSQVPPAPSPTLPGG